MVCLGWRLWGLLELAYWAGSSVLYSYPWGFGGRYFGLY